MINRVSVRVPYVQHSMILIKHLIVKFCLFHVYHFLGKLHLNAKIHAQSILIRKENLWESSENQKKWEIPRVVQICLEN